MAEKINIIVTEKALTDLNTAIEQVKKLEGFINKAGTPSTNEGYTEQIKKQSKEIRTLTEKISELELAKKKITAVDTQEIADNQRLNKEIKAAAMANSSLAGAYEKLNRERTISKNKLQDLIASERASNAEIRKAQKEFDVLNKKVAAADKAVGKFSEANSKINGLSRSVGNLMTAFGVGTGLYLAVDIVKNIFNTTLALQEMDLSLNAVSGSVKKFEENSSFLSRIAKSYGGNIEKLTHSFVQFYASAKDKIAEREIKNIFESITKSGAFLGLSMERQERGFLALQQMMSKTTVMAEELRGQLSESLPNAVGTMTKAYQKLHPEMKVTEKFFLEQVKAGRVLSAEILPEYAKQLEISLGIENTEKINTARVAIGRLKLAWIELIRAISESNLGDTTGQIFAGMSIMGTSLLNKIKRGFQNLGQLSSEAMRKGIEEGRESAEKGIYDENVDKRLNKAREQIIKSKKEYDLELKALEASQRKLRFTPKSAVNKQLIEELEQQIEQSSNMVGFWKGYIEQSAEIVKELKTPKVAPAKTQAQIDAEIEANAKANEKRLKAIEESAKLDYDLALSNANRKKEIIEDELNAFRGSIEEKIQLSYKLALAENKINKIKLKEDKRLSKGDGRLIGIAENEEFKAQGDSIQNNLKRIGGYWKEYFKELDTLPDTLFGDKYKLTPEQKEALEQYNNKIKSELKATMETFKMFAGDFADRLGFTDTFDFLLNPDKEGNTLFDRLKKDEDHWKDYALAITTVMQDAYNFINQQSQARFQAERERLESQKETALKNAGDGAAAKEKIEADYEKKKKEIERREAKAKKQQALFNIAIDTAQAVMAVSAKAQWWMIPAMIAMGAIQAGMVASQKIPEYWRGTKNAEEGLALTNERGAEIHTDKKGNIKDFGSNKGARLTKMSAGDVVYTAEETRRMMFENEYHGLLRINGIGNAKPSSGMTATEMKGIMVETLGGRPTLNMNFDKGGFGTYISKNGNITRESELRGLGRGIEI